MTPREAAIIRDLLSRARLSTRDALTRSLQEHWQADRHKVEALQQEVAALRERNEWLEDELLRLALLRHGRVLVRAMP